ncbi:Ribokinase [uncultured Gammaproteobacteria bacterium]
MLPMILAQVGLPLLVRAAGAALGTIDSPLATGAAQALSKVESAFGDGSIPPEAVTDANRHIERMAEWESADYQTAVREINQTMRAEAASGDAYVRRMRPTFGYIMALTWLVQMGALAWVIVANPGQAGGVINAMSSLATIWTVGLSVLGIYVYQRSTEKKLAGGVMDSRR